MVIPGIFSVTWLPFSSLFCYHALNGSSLFIFCVTFFDTLCLSYLLLNFKIVFFFLSLFLLKTFKKCLFALLLV